MLPLSAWATELHARLKGPNYTQLSQKASSLASKRKREVEQSSGVLVPRYALVSQAGKFTDRTNSGAVRLKNFLKSLQMVDMLYKKRSIGQRDFHEAFVSLVHVLSFLAFVSNRAPTKTIASLPHIVGEEEWDKNRSLFLEMMDTDEYRGEVLSTTPRRFGKTTAVSMFVACLLMACPGMWVSIFSTGQRASKSLLQQIREVIDVFPGMKKRILSSNVEELYIQPQDTTMKKDVSRCFSYPSSVKGEYL